MKCFSNVSHEVEEIEDVDLVGISGQLNKGNYLGPTVCAFICCVQK